MRLELAVILMVVYAGGDGLVLWRQLVRRGVVEGGVEEVARRGLAQQELLL